ncbi:MAG: hypothetical protein A2064_12710 [Spirochaetes bacterium GWB1_66_5]|nr:MAG: hypothetical protein A2064_12710 [Spirochaetes bacterium GWB1_66_5]
MNRAWLALLLLPAALAGCRRPPAAELRVGLVVPLSGSLQDAGISCREGAELAVKELNDAGGLLVEDRRYRVQLLIGDTQDSPERALSAAQELINRDNVAALIGPPYSSQAIPVARLAERSGIPMIVQLATNPEVTAGTSCVFRVCFTDGFQGRVMALFARDRLGARRAAILYDVANPFSRDIADIFTATFTDAGGRVVAREGYPTGQPDYLPELARIRAADPEVLFLPGLPPDLRRQLAQIRSLGLTVQVLGGDTMYFRNPADLPLVEGAYFSTHFSSEMPGEAVRAFNRMHQRAYRRLPTPAGALTYDAFRLLFSVIRSQGDASPAGICAGLRKLHSFEGVTGTMIFAGSPDPAKSVVIIHARDRQYRFHARIDP